MASSGNMLAARPGHAPFAPATRRSPMLSRALYLAFWQISVAAAAPIKQFLRAEADEDLPKDPHDPSLWLYLTVAAVLVLLGGAFAGLTIALMGQDSIYLQVIAASGEGKEQRHAQSVYRLLMRGKHWVLVTLLLSNVIVNETLPIVLDRSLGGGWPAVLGSTVLIVIFGEVIPQSVCVRYGLSIGAYMAPFVLALMWLMAPVAWPTAKLLDWLLGEDHGTVYKKSGLKTLVTLHKTLGPSPSDRLNQDEVTIISAVLDLKDKPIGDIMTPMDDVFTMSADTVLDEETMDVILTAGYSRIPIYEPGNETNFVGMLLVKILITYDPEDAKKVNEFSLATLPETRPETSCLDIVNFFQEGKSHMVLVSENPGEDFGAIGVVTLEDVIEELIGEEIIDESDVYIDVHKAIRRMAPAPKTRLRTSRDQVSRELVPQTNGQLIDISEEPSRNLEAPSANEAADAAKRKSVDQSREPKTTFHRRASSGNDGAAGTVPVRGSMDDMREHLKHLGPSNLASRPKTTRYNTVKIKPGHMPPRRDSQAESLLTREIIAEEPSTPIIQPGEGDTILRSAGKGAKDGVQALQQGITGLASEPRSESRKGLAGLDGLVENNLPTLEATKSHGSHGSHGSSRSPCGSRGSNSTDTLGSLPDGTNGKPRKKRAARSGSITENVVEAGGIRKVVLETNDSPESENEEPAADVSRSSSIPGLLSAFTGSGDTEASEPLISTNRSDVAAAGNVNNDAQKKARKKKGKKKRHGSTS